MVFRQCGSQSKLNEAKVSVALYEASAVKRKRATKAEVARKRGTARWTILTSVGNTLS
jgi:hypothetical protein